MFGIARAKVQLTGSKRVIECGDISLMVDSTGNVDTSFLTAGKIDTLLSDRLGITVGQQVQIGLKTSLMNDVPVSFLVEGSSKEDVFSHSGIANPRHLRTRSRATSKHDLALRTSHLSEKRAEEGTLSGTNFSDDGDETVPRDFEVDVLELEYSLNSLDLAVRLCFGIASKTGLGGCLAASSLRNARFSSSNLDVHLLSDLDLASLPVFDPSERLLGVVPETLTLSRLTVLACTASETSLLGLGVLGNGLLGRIPSKGSRFDLDSVIRVLVDNPMNRKCEIVRRGRRARNRK